MDEAEYGNNKVKENPGAEEKTTAALVDHPYSPTVHKGFWCSGLRKGCTSAAGRRLRALKALKTTTLGFVASEVGRVAVGIAGHVWMLVEKRILIQEGILLVDKVEAGGAFGGHGRANFGQ
jgi:hypothetical protein